MGESSMRLQFQCGLERGSAVVDLTNLTLATLKDYAFDYIHSLRPGGVMARSAENLWLFLDNSTPPYVPQLINSVTDLTSNSLVHIILRVVPDMETGAGVPADSGRPHHLAIHSYRTPTFCDHCGEMLFGLVRQGLKCDACGKSFHKRCVAHLLNDCRTVRTRTVSPNLPESISNMSLLSHDSDDSPAVLINVSKIGSSLCVAGTSISSSPRHTRKLCVPHTFVVHSYRRPTKCGICTKLLVGVYKQGLQCCDCKLNVHKKCSQRAAQDCSGLDPTDHSSSREDIASDQQESDTEDCEESPSPDVTNLQQSASPRDHQQQQFHAADEQRTDGGDHQNIPVQRLYQSVKHRKTPTTVLRDGWLTHFTDRDCTRRSHFWRLDNRYVTLYHNKSDSKFYKEIALSEILTIENCKPHDMSHSFVIRTTNLDYFVQCNDGDGVTSSDASNNATGWVTSLRQLMMPPGSSATTINNNNNNNNNVLNINTDHTNNNKLVDAEDHASPDPCTDITTLYQVYSDDILGSGQFGVVYRGVHRVTARPVAVKMINKLRFPNKQETQLKNEVAILQTVSFPGVVILERMFETDNAIFVVMEQLAGDMLEMILQVEKLCERKTRFLITQILVALKYLHSQNIVHCDLKPENVLLTSRDAFPQVKICDFGYAKIIGERSFRRSVVGTPAYLAPEVLRNKGYNRSLDMWSVGIIIYVSLSGTFPFNDDEDIGDQIQNAGFMYPPVPWKTISSDAIDLINCLLRVKPHRRYSVDKTLMHPWLQDFTCWSDLRALEMRLSCRYLTHESDDARWLAYQQQKHQNQLFQQ